MSEEESYKATGEEDLKPRNYEVIVSVPVNLFYYERMMKPTEEEVKGDVEAHCKKGFKVTGFDICEMEVV